MLIRIVRLTFRPDATDAFETHFEAVAPKIRGVDGCEHLELWQDADAPAVYTTCSHWRDDDALQAYRHSDLFRGAWTTVKAWFDDAPTAHSYHVAHPAATITRRA